MTQTDEEMFLAFLHQTGDIILIERFAKSSEELWSLSFAKEPKRFDEHWFYDIWNKAFQWTPQYNRTQSNDRADRNGLYYVSNTQEVPLLKFMRSGDISNGQYGELRWTKSHYAALGLQYDVDKFTVWYERIVRWMKRNAAGKLSSGGITIYYLPDAWRIYSELQQKAQSSDTTI